MPIKMTHAEIIAFIAKHHDRIKVSTPVQDALAEIAAKLAKPKGGVNRNAMQERHPDDKFKTGWERIYRFVLIAEVQAGTIARWAYEPMGLRIDDGTGKSCVFYPDFGVWYPDGRLEFREIKGKGKHALTPEARVKFLAARRLFPEHTFRMIQKIEEGWEEIL
jgi:hypothetical protein